MKNSDEAVIIQEVDQELNLELIIFTVANHSVAIPMTSLIEIIEAVPVSSLPFVPAYVDGLINVNGKILPQVNLNALMFNEFSVQVTQSFEDTVLIVSADGIFLALKIALVKESISIARNQIHWCSSEIEPLNSRAKPSDPYILGTFTHLDQKVSLFDVSALKDVVRASAQPSGKPSFLGKVTQVKTQVENYSEYLIAEVANKEYAFELEDVAEIIIIDVIKSQPRAPKLISGIGLVRGEPRLILNLAELLGLEGGIGVKELANAVIMVKFGDIYCGVLADKMVGLETVKQSAAKQTASKKNKPILREDGATLTQVLHFNDIFSEAVLGQIRPFMPVYKDSAEQIVINQLEMLRFELNGDAYALHLPEIRRVVSGKIIEPLLSEHAYIMGTMELEGKVIPVIDLVKQLGYGDLNLSSTEYIVVNDGHNDWAMAIGLSDQIVKIDENKIDPVKNQDVKFVAGFATYNESLLTILNIRTMCKENHHAGVL